MKKLFLFLLINSAFLILNSASAQAPLTIPYQAVARDNAGNFIANQNISLRFSIHDVTANGTIVYQETQTDTTNVLGLFISNIGQGTPVSGTFASVDWGNGAKFIQVEMDATGGNTYVNMGTQQMLSVPYALNAGSSLHSTGSIIDPGHPNTNSWTLKASLGFARSNAVAFSIGNKGYIGTGMALTPLNDFWEFDPITNAWTQKANFAGGSRRDAVGFSIGTKGYIGTGNVGMYNTNDFWEYDPTSNAWTQKASMDSTIRSGAVGFSIGNKGYIGIGNNGTSDLNDFFEYDPNTDTWTEIASYPGGARKYAFAAGINSKAYLGLGTDANGNYYNDMWEYNPATNAWMQKGTFPGSGFHSMASFTMGGKGYMGTGYNGATNMTDFYEYNPTTDVWTQKASFSGAARKLAVGFSIGPKGYIATGDIGPMQLNDVWEYMDDNVTGTAYSSNTSPANNSVNDGAWTLHNNQVYNSNSGNVGVGTSSPTNKLSVVGNADFDGNVGIGTTSPKNKLSVVGNASVNGNLGIGTSSPTAQLHTIGSVRHEDLSGVGLRPVFANATGNLEAIKEIVNSSNNNAQSFFYGCPGTTSTILLYGLPNSIPTNAISVTLNISHNQISGLSIYLQAPNGDVLLLASSNGGSGGVGFVNTVFSDASGTTLPYNNTGSPFTGTYFPTGGSTSVCGFSANVYSFSAIGGGNINPNGNWVLKIFDLSGIVGNTLNNWSIKINNIESGTDNYMPKWSNHTLTTKSLIYDNGTSVGIGTTAPGNMLTIEGSANNPSLSSNGILKINSGYNSINFGSMTSSPFSSWIQSSNAGTIALPLALQVAGGNVGIGVSNPVSKLNLVGAGSNPSIPGSSSTGIFRIGVGTSEGIDFGKMSTSPFSGWIQSGYNGASTDPLVVQPLGGNFGIGTTAPHAPLQFNSIGANRKIVLFEDVDNDHQFYGLGINAASMRYQVGSTGASHIFYAGNGSSASNELMRIQGNGRVGIGTSVLNEKLSISNSDAALTTVTISSPGRGTQQSHIHYGTYGDWYIRPATSPGNIYISDLSSGDFSGSVGIGTTFVPYKFTVNGNAAKNGSSTWIVTSDKRLKQNISSFTNGLSELLKINPVWFNYNSKSGYDTSKRYVGVLAQELKEVSPYMVDEFSFNRQDASAEKYLSVDNGAMTYMLINSVKEQQQQIEELKKQNAEQQLQNRELLKRIISLEKK